ncbi:MAG: D-Ala-D-Ala carboxypeptidase family metallohydrolase [Bacteroidales bacterium]
MKHFNINVLTKTSTGISNIPNAEHIANLIYLVENLLDKAREQLGMPITVTSGYRSEAVNKAVGGVATSQHTKGEAVDLVCGNNAKLFNIIKTMNFDQLIWEKGNSIQPAWVHVSLKRIGINRKQIIKL